MCDVQYDVIHFTRLGPKTADLRAKIPHHAILSDSGKKWPILASRKPLQLIEKQRDKGFCRRHNLGRTKRDSLNSSRAPANPPPWIAEPIYGWRTVKWIDKDGNERIKQEPYTRKTRREVRNEHRRCADRS